MTAIKKVMQEYHLLQEEHEVVFSSCLKHYDCTHTVPMYCRTHKPNPMAHPMEICRKCWEQEVTE